MIAEYRLGQVEAVKVSKDGLVRVVKVRTVGKGENKFTIVEKPIHKLCVIVPIEEQK